MAAVELARIQDQSSVRPLSDDEWKRVAGDTSLQKKGTQVFESKCANCHGKKGEGGIGPNLTDGHWIHGGKLAQIAAIIEKGVNEKGMPPWGAVLSRDELRGAVAYIRTLRGTNPPGAKAA